MKYLLVLLFLLIISACGSFQRGIATYTGYSKICVDGVEYLQFTSGASVSYNINGTIKVCDK